MTLRARGTGGCMIGCLILATVLSGAMTTPPGVKREAGVRPAPGDWPTYGHDAQRTFHGTTTLTAAQVPTLARAWFFRTGDAVTATPTVVRGTVYVGSWDGFFYAIDLRSGRMRWKFRLDRQPSITPQPGQHPRDVSSTGGLVTSSAWYQPGSGDVPDLVLFGGGFTLYALNAHSGLLVWKHAYTGNPSRPPDPQHDATRIFSSPLVAAGKVFIGVASDRRGQHGYLVAASLRTGRPLWTFETDVDAHGRIQNDGCGNIWSSGTWLPRLRFVVFDVADCNFANPPPFAESVVALHADTGRLAWRFRPNRPDTQCDTDFGATANAGVTTNGSATFLGVGSKDGTYYALDPRTGELRWQTNVVFGGFSGGFIATTAYDGQHVYGSTALGDFGRFERGATVSCAPDNPRDQQIQEPSAHAFDAATGAVLWQAEHSQAFGPTTTAGGFTFHGLALQDTIQVRDATTGAVLAALPTEAPCWSGITTTGNAIVFGTGASQQAAPDGISAFTPNGEQPTS